MTTLTNSEGKVLIYTNELIETILSKLNSSNNYYTTGDNDIFYKDRFQQNTGIRLYLSYKQKYFSELYTK